jgi:LysM repeat protein
MEKVKSVIGLLALLNVLLLGSCFGKSAVQEGELPSDPEPSAPVREQIERLSSFDPVERAHAAQALGTMGEEAVPAVPFLIRALNDSARFAVRSPEGEAAPSSVAEAAMMALVSIGAPAVDPLISTLGDTNPGVRVMVTEALGRIQDPGTIEPLIKVLESDPDCLVQATAVDALRKKKDPRALEALVLAEDHGNWMVRSLARSAAEEARTEAGDEGPSAPGDVVSDRQDPTGKRVGGDGDDARDGDERRTEEPSAVRERPETVTGEGEPVSSDEGIPPAEGLTHVVERGDTLYSLGRRYGVPWETLMTYNNLHDPTNLNVGQTLRIPAEAGIEGGPARDGESLYTVQHGDNLYEIGLLFGMSWRWIAERNGLADPGQIFVGQVLTIPSKGTVPPPP